jgi:type III secretion protein U
MSGESEEKTLPPTAQKLKKAREKGQVVTSKEAVMSLTGIASIAYLYLMQDLIAEKLRALWVLEITGDQRFAVAFQSKLVIVGQLGLSLVVPLFGIVIVTSIFGGMMVAGGPLFTTETITPKFEKIDPVSGAKRIFSKKAIIAFLMHLLRLTVLTVIFGLILAGTLGPLMLAPVCGMTCAAEGLSQVVGPLVLAAVVIMTIMVIFDYLVEKASFLKEQKMSFSEFKREMKDQQGDPYLKGRMQSDQRQMLTAPVGARQATLIITGASGSAVGVRYVDGETPAPVIVAKSRAAPSTHRMIATAKVHREDDAELVEMLIDRPIGSYVITDEAIMKLAPLMQRAIANG